MIIPWHVHIIPKCKHMNHSMVTYYASWQINRFCRSMTLCSNKKGDNVIKNIFIRQQFRSAAEEMPGSRYVSQVEQTSSSINNAARCLTQPTGTVITKATLRQKVSLVYSHKWWVRVFIRLSSRNLMEAMFTGHTRLAEIHLRFHHRGARGVVPHARRWGVGVL